MPTAKIFWSGNSQAVRLPKEYRFTAGTEEVSIRREGEGIVLEPLGRDEWPQEFWWAFEGMPKGFERPSQQPQVRDIEL
ncbi:MAG TPA: AbrB/MazE/SpoVT family DNA-binding domain-containing protein [Thermoanaerobaculia bacterium]|nr:AbrB/MazE/SpoVT family DNA-binding domain-containing protein [Thermoanaerobaculia bacterium]